VSDKYQTVSIELTTSNQDIYTAPAQFTTDIVSIFITNLSGTTVTFNLDWYDSSATAYNPLADEVELVGGGMIQVTEALQLDPNDKIRGLASANSSVRITVRAREESIRGIA